MMVSEKNMIHSSEMEFKNPVWSADGSKIAFLSNRHGMPDEEFGYAYEPMDIFMRNADGSNLTNMTNRPDNDEVN